MAATRRKPRDATGALRLLACFRSPERKPFAGLCFDPHDAGRLLAVQGADRKFPKTPVHLFALPSGEVLHSLDGDWFSGDAHFLRDGRILLADLEIFDGKPALRVVAWAPGAARSSVLTDAQFNNASRHVFAVDPAERLLAVATLAGATLCRVGEPWEKIACVGGPVANFGIVAVSSDTRHLLWTSHLGEAVHLVDRATGDIRWTLRPFAGHHHTPAVWSVAFTHDGGHVLLHTTHRAHSAGQDTVFVRELHVYRVADGARDRADLEAACAGLQTFAVGPRDLLAVAGEHAGVTLLRATDSAVLGALAAREQVTALGFDATAGRLAAGTRRGEALLLAVDGA